MKITEISVQGWIAMREMKAVYSWIVLYIHKSRWREGMREGRQVEIKVIKGNNYHIQMRRKVRNKIE